MLVGYITKIQLLNVFLLQMVKITLNAIKDKAQQGAPFCYY